MTEPLLRELQAKGISRLANSANQKALGGWSQGWISVKDLNLQDEREIEWTQYTEMLNHSAIHLLNQDDESLRKILDGKQGKDLVVEVGVEARKPIKLAQVTNSELVRNHGLGAVGISKCLSLCEGNSKPSGSLGL
jgi:hypothetical protein